MRQEKLNVLLVWPDEADARFLLAELEHQGFAPSYACVSNQAALLTALRLQPWDVVITTYHLPQFSGIEAVQCLRREEHVLPCLMVADSHDAETAFEALMAGVNAYLLRSSLARLGTVIKREMQAAEGRRQRQRAEGARQFLAAIVESSDDAIYGKNLDGRIVSWNPAAERIYGYSAEEIIGQSTVRLFPLHLGDELLEVMAACRRGEIVRLPDTERVHKNGRIIPVSVILSPVYNQQGQVIGASAIARDLSRQKQQEAECQCGAGHLPGAPDDPRPPARMLSICASCKNIRNGQDHWEKVETYFLKHSGVTFSHGLCPECLETFSRDLHRHGSQLPTPERDASSA